MIAAIEEGKLDALVVGGVDPYDYKGAERMLDAFDKAFVVALDIAHSTATAFADVVLPVAAVAEKNGSFLNWEGRARSFDVAITDSIHRSDARVLSMIATEMGVDLGLTSAGSAAQEFATIGTWDGARAPFTPVAAPAPIKVGGTDALLTSWRRLLDLGTLQKGEENLAGTARQTVAVISPARAQSLGVVDGDLVRIANSRGSVVLPVLVENIHDDAVWAPRNSRGSQLLATLDAAHGEVVTVVKA